MCCNGSPQVNVAACLDNKGLGLTHAPCISLAAPDFPASYAAGKVSATA